MIEQKDTMLWAEYRFVLPRESLDIMIDAILASAASEARLQEEVERWESEGGLSGSAE